MDEAAARLKMQVDSKPEELDSLDREIIRLKIEQEALKKETDAGSKSRLQTLEKELAELEEKSAALTARWSAEKNKLSDAQKLKSELDALRIELANAQRRGEFQRAGELAYGRIPELEKKLAEIEAKETTGEMMEEAVTANHIAQVVSRWTGVPVDKMLEGEKDKLLKMEDAARQARRRPGRGRACGGDRRAPFARRPAGSEPPDRLVHVPGADRRRQDRADESAGRVSVQRRDRDGPPRHVRIHGEALGVAADRRASGLCRL